MSLIGDPLAMQTHTRLRLGSLRLQEGCTNQEPPPTDPSAVASRHVTQRFANGNGCIFSAFTRLPSPNSHPLGLANSALKKSLNLRERPFYLTLPPLPVRSPDLVEGALPAVPRWTHQRRSAQVLRGGLS